MTWSVVIQFITFSNHRQLCEYMREFRLSLFYMYNIYNMGCSKKIFWPFLFIVLVIGIVLIVGKNNSDTNFQKLAVIDEITSRLSSADPFIDIQNGDGLPFRWVKDGYTILVPPTTSFMVKKQSVGDLKLDAVPALFNKEIFIIDNVLKGRGYILDQENSLKNFADQSFYDYILAYKQDANFCVMSISPDYVKYYQLDFSCGDSLDREYEKQLPFLKVLNLKDKKTSAKIRSQKGDYYEVDVSGTRGGSIAVLKKENDTYRILFIGQEAPQCSLIKKEHIPNEVLISIGGGNCFADDGSYVKN